MPENKVSIKKIVTNRKARYNYLIVKKLETGIELRGTEVKSLRAGKGNLSDSYARVENGEVFLHNLHISPYEHGSFDNHKPLRRRRLLLHKREIRKLFQETSERGAALIPLSLYFKHGIVKVELALAHGKKTHDRRDDIRKREDLTQIRRALKKQKPRR